MGLKNIHLKLKAFRVRRFYLREAGKNKRETRNGSNKPSWMMPVSHGFHVVEDMLLSGDSNEFNSDTVVVQREQIEEHELWFFGLFDARIRDGVTKYMQSHLFDKKPKQMRMKGKETIRNAYIGAKAKIRETSKKQDDIWNVGSASAIVIDGDKLVVAYMGEYRAVVCRDGEAHQISRSRKFFSGAIRVPKVRMLACHSISAARTKPYKSSEITVKSEKIDTSAEFVILASTGIWKVMKHQEAINLIRHLDDPQEAAECLAKEALTRMSKRNISCLIIRFD